MFTLSLYFLAVTATEAAGNVLNKNEFDALLLGQFVQIIAVLASIGVSIKALKRNPPVGEDIVRLQVNQEAFETRLTKIEERLAEGDSIFRENGREDAAARATLDALKQDMHLIKSQMAVLLGRLGGNHASH